MAAAFLREKWGFAVSGVGAWREPELQPCLPGRWQRWIFTRLR
jgi:hypothetical protein